MPGASRPPDRYRTPAAPGQAELKVQRSRFLAWVGPASDEDAARAAVQELARLHHDARHVCHAWRLGTHAPHREARHDAGEPAGTAGEPILAALRRADLSDCVGVVLRWFGGVKLGTGGLARAYGEAADLAAAAAPVRVVLLGRTFDLRLPYAQQKTARHLVAARDGRVLEETYGADVAWRVWLPHSRAEGFAADLAEATAGAALAAPGPDTSLPVP